MSGVAKIGKAGEQRDVRGAENKLPKYEAGALQIIKLATEQAERIRNLESDRNTVIEECASNLAAWYPDNVSTNAFCAALRSMKSTST